MSGANCIRLLNDPDIPKYDTWFFALCPPHQWAVIKAGGLSAYLADLLHRLAKEKIKGRKFTRTELFILNASEEMTDAEIAARLGVHKITVRRARLRVAEAPLRRRIDDRTSASGSTTEA